CRAEAVEQVEQGGHVHRLDQEFTAAYVLRPPDILFQVVGGDGDDRRINAALAQHLGQCQPVPAVAKPDIGQDQIGIARLNAVERLVGGDVGGQGIARVAGDAFDQRAVGGIVLDVNDAHVRLLFNDITRIL